MLFKKLRMQFLPKTFNFINVFVIINLNKIYK